MTVSAIITAFQTLHATITGVTQAPTVYTARLNTSELPIVLTWPGPTLETEGWTAQGGGWYSVRRYYIVRCYVKPLAQGGNFDNGFQEAITLLQRFGAAYMTDAATAGGTISGAVAHMGPRILDTGVRSDFDWSGVAYHGFEFQVEIAEKV